MPFLTCIKKKANMYNFGVIYSCEHSINSFLNSTFYITLSIYLFYVIEIKLLHFILSV